MSCLLFATSGSAEVAGRVVNQQGHPVEGAEVVARSSADRAVTDRDGRFVLRRTDPQVTLVVSHPRFFPREVVPAEGASLEIAMEPKREVYGEIQVTTRGHDPGRVGPVVVATSSASVDDAVAPVASLVELAEAVPGLSQNGQGGRFQAYSIRGFGGLRVFTSVAGVRIVTERRAGATASFVDPLLLGEAEVIRGPASTFYGSGAMGGVLQTRPRRYSGLVLDTGWTGQGDEHWARVGWGDDAWSVGLARRDSGDAETPDGDLLYSRYEQWSAALSRRWTSGGGTRWELVAVPAVGRDIGKPNRRYPGRITTYPAEDHLVLSLGAVRPDGWAFELVAHPNGLDSRDERATSDTMVASEAFDFGSSLRREQSLGESWTAIYGLDYFGRRGVESTESVRSLATGEVTSATTLDGEEDEAALFGSVRRPVGRAVVEIGGRYAWQRQANLDSGSSDDSAGSGFVGLTLPLGGGFEAVTSLGTGLRFPSLSERFFTGTTGRGEVVANEDLAPERAVSADVGLRWYGERLFVAVYAFRSEVDDYIEQVELEEGVDTFVNLGSGTLDGFEVEGSLSVRPGFSLDWTGQRVTGDADDGAPLADVPADRLALAARFERGPVDAALRWVHRFEKDDPGPGELAIGSAEIVSASVGVAVGRGLTLRVHARNLLDRTYQPTADDLAVPAPGRSLGLSLRWTGS